MQDLSQAMVKLSCVTDDTCCRVAVHHWNEALDNGKSSIRTLFVDYAKAFDHVDHGTMPKKLYIYGVSAFIINCLVSFFQERQQRVKISDVLSRCVTLHGGTSQASWFGPLVFLILIDDLRLQFVVR